MRQVCIDLLIFPGIPWTVSCVCRMTVHLAFRRDVKRELAKRKQAITLQQIRINARQN